ncbi:hypothetical protein VB005_01538 [Metarhizium brunneum]
MKNVVLVGLFLAGSTLAQPCNDPSSSQDKPATEVNSVNLDYCAKITLAYLQEELPGCKELPCGVHGTTRRVLGVMTDCLIGNEPTFRDWDCEKKAIDSTVECFLENPPSHSSTYTIDAWGKRVPTDENLRVTRQCSQQAIPVYKQCVAAGEQL